MLVKVKWGGERKGAGVGERGWDEERDSVVIFF